LKDFWEWGLAQIQYLAWDTIQWPTTGTPNQIDAAFNSVISGGNIQKFLLYIDDHCPLAPAPERLLLRNNPSVVRTPSYLIEKLTDIYENCNHPQIDVVILGDCSGRMGNAIQGPNWLTIASHPGTVLVQNLPNGHDNFYPALHMTNPAQKDSWNLIFDMELNRLVGIQTPLIWQEP
jgi:hypothetical protein